LFLAWYGLLESSIDSLLYKKVSKNLKNYCTCRSLPKSTKTSFCIVCPLGVKENKDKLAFNIKLVQHGAKLMWETCGDDSLH
jgi:hypothetical protein